MIGKQQFKEDERITRLIQQMPAAVYTTDEDGILTFYNQKAVDLWGYRPRLNDPKESRYSGSFMMFKPDGTPLPHDQSPMAIALKQQQSISGEEIIIERLDGSRIIALVNISPLFDNGRFSGAINVLQDVTAQNSNKKAVWRLAAIVNSSDDAIVSETLTGLVTSWNHGAEKMFGYMEEEMLGQAVTIIFPPERKDEEDMILEQIRNGKLVDHFETARKTKNGKIVPVSITVSPVKDSRGRITGVSKVIRDISEQVKSRNQMQQLNQRLQKLNEYKDEFIGMASHELKTPITVIKNHLQLLGLKISEEELKSSVSKAINSVDKLSTLVSDLLDVSKIEGEKLQLNYSRFDVVDLISDSIQNLQITESTHQIIFNKQSESIIVNADKQRIEQVIINLLTNAIKYSPDAEKVVVKVTSENSEVMISVTDFGIGIPEELQNKVFSRFFRAEGLSTAYSGLGIGLFISKDIVERHQGTIWVESEVDEGSTFYIKLPVNPPCGSGETQKAV